MARQRKTDFRLMRVRAAAFLAGFLIIGGIVLRSWLAPVLPEMNFPAAFAVGGAFLLAWLVAVYPFPYWCPQCHKRLKIMEEKRPMHLYHCPACDVEWNIGSSDDNNN
jgi:hypothetical protein